MFSTMFIFITVFVIVSLLLPWICVFQINALKKRVNELTETKHAKKEETKVSKTQKTAIQDFDFDFEFDKKQNIKTESETQKIEDKPESLEYKFGTNFFVWLGGIAIAFAGIYFVKYSIENNLISPLMRLVMGLVFGSILLGAGSKINSMGSFISNGEKISQALIGAAIVVFYASFYTGSNLFDVLSPAIGFAGMVATTILAILFSVRFGPPIAILGLVGGFITPGLFESDSPQASLLFTYLFILVAGFFAVITLMNWWFLGVVVVAFSYLWVAFWLFTGFREFDSIWLSLFVIGVCATAVSSAKYEFSRYGKFSEVNILTVLTSIVGGIIMIAFVTKYGGMRIEDWVYFAFMVIFAYGFSYFEQGKYIAIPWIAMLVNMFMIVTWQAAIEQMFFVILAFNIIFSLPAYFGMLSRHKPEFWALQGMVANILYYFLAYWKTFNVYDSLNIKLFWGVYALALALGGMLLLNGIIKRKDNYSRESYKAIISILAVGVVTFVTTALLVEIDKRFFHLVLSAEILTIAWINSRPMHLEALRYVIAILLGIIFFAQIDHIYRICGNFMTFQLFGEVVEHYRLNFLERPILHYGSQSLMLGLATYYLLREKNSTVVWFVEGFTVVSLMFMGALAIGNYFALTVPSTNVIQRGSLNLYYFILGAAVLTTYNFTSRKSLMYWGIFIITYSVFRVIMLEYIHFNPYLTEQHIGGVLIFNKMLLNFVLPLAVVYWLRKQDYMTQYPAFKKAMSYFLFIGTMIYISLCVRHFFHPEYLNAGAISNSEMYSYSVVWLLLGIFLAYVSVLTQDNGLRRASMVVMFITVGKVFLIDARELEGLLRVISFLGLGISLLGLSYFYSRFLSVKK